MRLKSIPVHISDREMSPPPNHAPCNTGRDQKSRMWDLLTPREAEICHLVLAGKSRREIGSELKISLSPL